MVIGTGVDLVEIGRVADILARHRERFLDRVFTAAEAAYCRDRPFPAQHFAARFAGKEAVLKALGAAGPGSLAWREIEILRSAGGEPTVCLHGQARAAAAARGVERIHLSLSHSQAQAVAVAVAVGGPPGAGEAG